MGCITGLVCSFLLLPPLSLSIFSRSHSQPEVTIIIQPSSHSQAFRGQPFLSISYIWAIRFTPAAFFGKSLVGEPDLNSQQKPRSLPPRNHCPDLVQCMMMTKMLKPTEPRWISLDRRSWSPITTSSTSASPSEPLPGSPARLSCSLSK